MTSTRTLTIRILRTFPLILATATLLATLAATASAQNPVPFIDQPLVPDATAPGGPAFTLTVNGAGFVPASVVNWSGSPRATTFVSSSQLTAKILASDVAKASTAASRSSQPQPWRRYFQHSVLLDRRTRDVGFVRSRGDLQLRRNLRLILRCVVADLNGDGKPGPDGGEFDGSSSVGVLLGNGDGTFQPASDLCAASSPAEAKAPVAVADVNGDGKLDLIVATVVATATADPKVGVCCWAMATEPFQHRSSTIDSGSDIDRGPARRRPEWGRQARHCRGKLVRLVVAICSACSSRSPRQWRRNFPVGGDLQFGGPARILSVAVDGPRT